jgi:hypothetical protein
MVGLVHRLLIRRPIAQLSRIPGARRRLSRSRSIFFWFGADWPMMRSSTADMVFEGSQRVTDQEGSVDVLSSHHLQHCQHWKYAFASQHKDHRYYEIVADTLHSEFIYLYFALRNAQGLTQAIQPFFILDQDILPERAPTSAIFLISSGGNGLDFCL